MGTRGRVGASLRAVRLLVPLSCLVLLSSCGDTETPVRPSPSPTPDPNTVVTPTLSTGPSSITFVNASPSPGSTIAGCGPDTRGCAGRVRMSFSIRSNGGGSALKLSVFLHSTEKRACLLAELPSFDLPAGQPVSVEVPFDRADACATPATIATMDAALEGTVEIASRQEWALHYVLAP